MLVVEVDGFHAKTPQTAFNGAADVAGRAIRAAPRAVGIDSKTELGGDDDAVARDLAEEPADEFLVGPWSVDFGGVEEIAAELEVAMEDAEGFVVVGGAISPGHAHAAEAQGRNGGTLL